MFRRASLSLSQAHSHVARQLRRNYGVTAPLAQQLDPIQQLFLTKTREYADKSKAAGGKPVDVGPEAQKAFQSEMDRIDTMFSAGPDFMKMPAFTFTDPDLEPVGVDVQAKEVEKKVKVKKDKWTRDPEEPWSTL